MSAISLPGLPYLEWYWNIYLEENDRIIITIPLYLTTRKVDINYIGLLFNQEYSPGLMWQLVVLYTELVRDYT